MAAVDGVGAKSPSMWIDAVARDEVLGAEVAGREARLQLGVVEELGIAARRGARRGHVRRYVEHDGDVGAARVALSCGSRDRVALGAPPSAVVDW